MPKSEAETISLMQDYTALWRIVIDYLEGAFTIQADACEDEITTGDSTPETIQQLQALSNLRASAGSHYSSLLAFIRTLTPTMGRLAGNPAPGSDQDADIAWLNDYLVDNTKAVLKRGFTKSAWTADGGNVGTGRIVQLTTDFVGDELDCAHPVASMRLRCMNANGPGVVEGQEQFELTGSAVVWPWEDNGIGDGALYTPPLGKGINELSADQLRVEGSGVGVPAMRSMSGGSPLNLCRNGDFEAAASGTSTSRYNNILLISGESNVSVESTSPLVGDQSIKIDGNCVFRILLNERQFLPKTAIAFGALVKKVISSSTLTGTLTIVLRSGGDPTAAASGTAHKTITVTIGSLSDNTITASDEKLILPASLGADPRLEFTVTSYSDGSGTANSLLIDEIYAGKMYQLDMGQFILPVRGATAWEVDDIFTASVTDLGGGEIQEMLNRVFGRYLKHGTSATDFTDPTLAPELVATGSVNGTSFAAHTDGDPIDHGTDSAASNVTFYVKFSNTGNYPLALGVPAESGATNCSIVSGLNTAPVVVMPGREYLFTIVVDISGAGAYDITLTWDTNDTSEATYEVDLIGTGS